MILRPPPIVRAILLLSICLSGCHTPEASQPQDASNPNGLLLQDTVRNDAGIVVGIGPMNDGKRNGRWTEYYADGVFMWEGAYASGERVATSRPTECNCQLDFMDDLGTGLHVGEAYRFRIRNGCLHDDDLALAATKSTVKRLRDTSGYNYILYPEKQETIKLMVYAADEGFASGPVCAFEIQVAP